MQLFLTVHNDETGTELKNKSLSELRNANMNKIISVNEFIKYLTKIMKFNNTNFNIEELDENTSKLLQEILNNFSFSNVIFEKFEQFLSLFYNSQ